MWHNALVVESLYPIPPLRMARIACELRPEGVYYSPVRNAATCCAARSGKSFASWFAQKTAKAASAARQRRSVPSSFYSRRARRRASEMALKRRPGAI